MLKNDDGRLTVWGNPSARYAIKVATGELLEGKWGALLGGAAVSGGIITNIPDPEDVIIDEGTIDGGTDADPGATIIVKTGTFA